jgi:hypothetical protein
MREIFDDNMVFHTSAEITNKGIGKNRSTKKTYNNVLAIKDDNFNDFLNTINGEEEIEEIKFKLKKKHMELKGMTVTK